MASSPEKNKEPLRMLRDVPINQKVFLIILLAIVFAAAVATCAVLTYETTTFRPRTLDKAQSQTKILGAVLVPPLQFNDSHTAELYLGTLRYWKDVRAAALWDARGNLFASYRRDGSEAAELPSRPPRLGAQFVPDHFRFTSSLFDENRLLGSLWFEEDMPPLYARLPQYGIMFSVLTLSLLAVAALLTVALKYNVSEPLAGLAGMALQVTEKKDYSLRASSRGKDEIGRLTSAFNQMLEAIEQRDNSLRDANASNEAILNTTIDGVAMEDENGRFLDVNPACCHLLGYKRQEMIGMRIADIDVAHSSEQVEALIRNIHEQGNTRFETRLRTKDGRLLDVEMAATLFSSTGSKLLFALRDVTERKLAEEALRESRKLLESIIDNSTAVIYVKDLEGRYMLVNRQFATLFHVSKEAVVGKSDHDIFPPDTAEKFRANDRRAIAAGHAIEVEENAPHDDGIHTYISIKGPLRNEAGRINSMCGISTDITERKRVEEQLRQSQKMDAIGRLAGGIAHDFNNLLTAINGYSSLALQALEPSHPLFDSIQEILKSGERAANLTRQLLAYSRKQVLEARLWNLNVIISDMEPMLKRLIGEDIALTTNLDPAAGQALVDRGQIEQILLNLVVNSRDAMPHGGRLIIESANIELDEYYSASHPEAAAGSYVVLSVSDTGLGMTPEVKARLFEPFFTTKPISKGTGLGLSVVYGIVKQSVGSVSVYSEPGKGTTFRIYFPEVKSPQAQSAMAVAPETRRSYRGTETILVVEDEDSVRKFTCHALETQGYTVLQSRNGVEALELLKASPSVIHMVVTDVVMPEMGGLQLAKEMHERNMPVPILFVSGYAKETARQNGLLKAGEFFLQKPFSPSELIRRVREILEGIGKAKP